MSYSNPYATPQAVAQAPADARTEFYKKTYLHLAGAVAALVLLEGYLLNSAIGQSLAHLVQASGLIALGVFMGATWLAEKWAHSSTSRGIQYAGLALTVLAYGIIFLPIISIAQAYAPKIIGQAGIITGAMFAGLTFVAFTSKKDFSFLGGMLKIGGFIAIGLIAASYFMGFNLGIWFSGAMVLLMSGSILHQTSSMIHHYRTEQYVAASVGLFASVAMLFFYVLRTLLHLVSSD